MDLRLTPDLIEIRERSRRFCDEWLIPFEHETEEAGSLSMESYARIREAVLEARLNAINMPASGAARASRSCSRSSRRSSSAAPRTRSGTCVWRPAHVLEHCTPAQRARYLEPEIRGERRYAYAITEPNAGSDPSRAARRRPRRDGGGWRINGEKWFVTDGDIADYLIVVADAEGHGPTCFLVDKRRRRACARRAGRASCTRSSSSIPEFTLRRRASSPTTRCSARLGAGQRADQGLVHRTSG